MSKISHDDDCSLFYSERCNCTASEPPFAFASIPTDFLHDDDWREFDQLHAAAASFLRNRNLRRELQYMETTGKASGLNPNYVTQRIAELRALGVATLEEEALANAGCSSLPGAAEDGRTSIATRAKASAADCLGMGDTTKL